ncbi:TonB-dependent receptor [Sphingomonas sp. BT-65]|uniref:TonB-dependent receptor n=1 Tax=Sphingomonas sp. BT-65 TaxID=2989821 RepID=UPI002235DDE3|nr:TonB-dependent receptor [Sphingomonas sp. BT-65]MCW4461266.1 TonB-dependent receptor [Sphingomonas sp. BT-65]
MRRLIIGLTAAGILAGAMPAVAQDEIIVTAVRKLVRDDDEDRPVEKPVLTPAAVQMLRRTADFAVQQVVVVSDTVEEEEARKEVQAMTRKAIDLSAGSGVQLASGEIVVEPLNAGNYKDLAIEEIDEDEISGEAVKFLVKVPLAPGIDAKAALARIDKFVKAVPAAGRAQMKAYSELTLSVVDPEQYRGAIIDLVAKDTAATSGRFGTGYGVEVTGLDKPVQWKRASLTEVQLFLPSNSTMRPKN